MISIKIRHLQYIYIYNMIFDGRRFDDSVSFNNLKCQCNKHKQNIPNIYIDILLD